MKKRLCSWVLALTMMLGLLPAAAFAADDAAIPFSARTGETALSVEKSVEDYTYTVVTEYDENRNPVQTEDRTASLYVVRPDVEITEVTLDFGEDEPIAYAYDASGNYLADCGEYGDGTTGQTTAVVTNLTAYVRVQTPYDESRKSEVLYAVAFDVSAQVPEGPDDDAVCVDALLTNIAADFKVKDSNWHIMDMAAYAGTDPDSPHKTTAEAKQRCIDSAIASLTGPYAGETDYAKAILTLQSIGADPQKLYPSDSSTPISAVEMLRNRNKYGNSAWVAPYTLIALNQGEYDTDELEQSIITAVLEGQGDNGAWSEYGDSIQTTSNMIAGLSFYYGTTETVKTALDKAVTFLSKAQKADGSFDAYGNGADANTIAMVVIGLAAMGIDPDTDPRFVKNGHSALENLLAFALTDHSGFGYRDNTTLNGYATEQGFRALVAARNVMRSKKPYNVYDFSANEVSPAYEGGKPADQEPDDSGNSPAPDTDITVSFTLKTHETTWISKSGVDLERDATVSDLIYAVSEQDDKLSFVDNSGYISSITYGGVTWAEFNAGPNSGWKYSVNGVAPAVGMSDCVLEDGDQVVWYYVTDYQTDTDRDEKPITPEKPKPPVEENPPAPFHDTTEHWASEAVSYCYNRGLMAGTGDTSFAPDVTADRGMIVTILYALEEKPAVSVSQVFADVRQDTYYANAAAWAAQIGIVSGSGGNFFPDQEITREQLALMLMNYARYKGYNTSSTNALDTYTDTGLIHDWALDAVRWANAEGMMSGRSTDAIAPQGRTTRGEVATILMQFLKNHSA